MGSVDFEVLFHFVTAPRLRHREISRSESTPSPLPSRRTEVASPQNRRKLGSWNTRNPFDSFGQDAHAKAQAAIDHAREVREKAEEELRKKHAEKVLHDARVIDDGGVMRCSVCNFRFDPDVKPSLSVAFTEHLSKAHKPGPTSET